MNIYTPTFSGNFSVLEFVIRNRGAILKKKHNILKIIHIKNIKNVNFFFLTIVKLSVASYDIFRFSKTDSLYITIFTVYHLL